MLIVVSGLPAVGKSTTAKEMARRFNARFLDSEVIKRVYMKRKEFFGPAKRMYSDRDRLLSYSIMFKKARGFLESGRNVVIEGTFYKKSLRDEARKMAKDFGTGFYLIEVTCPEDVIRKRLEKRMKLGRNKGVVDFDMFTMVAENFEPIRERHIIIDSTLDLNEQLDGLKIK